ncbi:hypothetical protein P053_01436 [Brucella abortus 01-4165]|uniref:NAD binding site:Zinc-containing alcohol dehydrogenase superfamily:Zinc-containing alcohol dehydrogenase n=4 Tax=Brucella abortus TaxID=235 RepID=Q2YK59_BRUA2|nr:MULTISPECIES: zinc-dependent alcohol dehydrogenase family protein [Brucella]ERM87573.1 alcohol dehydrogenase [Brucella abortus 82]ERT81039.1 hypothetical protein P050_02611 [Brucella abortus 90-12178]ERU06216.1 hypothetical protein P038_00954 [Brucella abortus 99-9971-135]KFH23659.1 alcohol dehydrogenase [Brucella abortus LMN1]KFH24759.1 alcohol dehydrogenase [Brucella abortus LMN2]
MKFKAAVLDRHGVERPYNQTKPLVIREVELREPKADEVLVKLAASGLCHSDLSVINGDRSRQIPMVLGHEAAGVVEKIGEGVTDLVPGDHVVCVFVPNCGHCQPCAEGRPALCEPGAAANGKGEMLSGGLRLFCDDGYVYHHCGVSAYAEYAVMSRYSIIRIEKDIPLHIAALMGCAVLTGTGSIFNTGLVKPGSRVAIAGLGGVGLAAVMGAVAAGATEIIALDMFDDKLALAEQLGATKTFNVQSEGVVEAVKEYTKGGVDAAFEYAGSGAALAMCYALTKRGGEVVTAGLPNPKNMLSIPAVSLVAEEKSIRGSYLGSGVPTRDIPLFLDLYRKGKLPVEKLLTHRIKLEEINEGFERLAAGKAIRQVVEFN